MSKKGKGFDKLTKRVLTDQDESENTPTSIADFQDGLSNEKKSKNESNITSPKKKLDQRITAYLSEDGLNILEDTWLDLRQMASPNNRKRISKSVILEEAILIAWSDLKEKREKSKFAKKILKQ